MCTAEKEITMEATLKLRPEKIQPAQDFNPLPLRYRCITLANWELTITLVSNKPVKYKYMKIIYVNCGERNEYA